MKLTQIVVALEVAFVIVSAASLMFISGCATTQLVDLWKDPSFQAAPMKKIMIIAVHKDQIRRRMWEDAFVSALAEDKAATVAVPSYQIFPNELPDTLTVGEKTKAEGFDGVLVVARVEASKQREHVPGYVSEEPVAVYRHGWGAYTTRWETVYHPGYTTVQRVLSVQTDLLLPQEDGRLVWSATSKEIDPSSPSQFRGSVADLVMDNLVKEGLVR